MKMAKSKTVKAAPSQVPAKKGDSAATSHNMKGKRKAQAPEETTSSKKSKFLNDGYCLFIGNLNNSKTFDEVRCSLENFLMSQSLLVQNIRLAASRTHAFIDLASEMDVTKALSLDGESILGQPVTIAKPKVKPADDVKKKAPKMDKKAKDARCLFLKNLPYDATRRDIREIFTKAIRIRFPDGAQRPDKGIAFLEFKNENVASKIRESKQGVKLQDRLLIIDAVGVSRKVKDPVPPSSTLFVSNLPFKVKEKNVKKVFKKALAITIPKKDGQTKGFAFVDFATMEDAQQALRAAADVQILKRPIRVEFAAVKGSVKISDVQSKTLIVRGLGDETTADILRGAFEGCLAARIATDKKTGKSKGFGFVEYESEELCVAAKEVMEDGVINGSKVSLGYARLKAKRGAGTGGRTDGTRRDVEEVTALPGL
ncbi:nucleolin-like isoform X2 [Corythoichthys intestinalis]|uniref:nucleolin-like isoform X2 n=1 Tax=Corythoichthys intestinalis TaxID=161448 RepID=UPI0025A56C8E|nr:nucleolin-like isoform X2 [Corythoichthys intestinalis]XP_061794908.1 nucleolin-like [Nerophis lumbriciformis]